MNLLAQANPFFSSYSQSDAFGKMIFLGLFLLSLISWTVMIYKIWQTTRVKKACRQFEKILEDKKNEPLDLKVISSKPYRHSFILNPYQEIYQTLKQKTHEILDKNRFFVGDKNPSVYLSRDDVELVESHIAASISHSSKSLEKHLFILPTIVTLGPFLGLLGTVWGILITFSELQSKAAMGSANSAILAGLSMALATTVLGLVIAIPALVGNSYLKSTIKDLRKDMENFSLHLLGVIEMQYRKVQQ
jgi:biopolymer transport protein TolQ